MRGSPNLSSPFVAALAVSGCLRQRSADVLHHRSADRAAGAGGAAAAAAAAAIRADLRAARHGLSGNGAGAAGQFARPVFDVAGLCAAGLRTAAICSGPLSAAGRATARHAEQRPRAVQQFTAQRPVYAQPQVRVQPQIIQQQPYVAQYAPPPQAARQAYAAAPANYAPDYTLDSGDKLRVVVFGQDGITNSYMVDAGGNINLPLIGSVPARGATTQARRASLPASSSRASCANRRSASRSKPTGRSSFSAR